MNDYTGHAKGKSHKMRDDTITGVGIKQRGALIMTLALLQFPPLLFAGRAHGETIDIISKDAPLPVIVHSDEKDPVNNPLVEYAALDLQRYLGRVTGRELSIGEEWPVAAAIHVGRTRYVESLRLGLDNLAWDGFIVCMRLRGDAPQLVIAGRTSRYWPAWCNLKCVGAGTARNSRCPIP